MLKGYSEQGCELELELDHFCRTRKIKIFELANVSLTRLKIDRVRSPGENAGLHLARPHVQFMWAFGPRLCGLVAVGFLHHNEIFDVIIKKSDYDIKLT